MSSRETSRQDGLVQRHRVGLMRGLLEHGGESEELPARRLVDDDFLLVLVDRGHPHRPESITYACSPGSPIL